MSRSRQVARIVQLTLGRRQFLVEVKRIAPLGHFGQSQRGLARLARAQQDHCRELSEQIDELLLGETRVYPCNLSL